MGFKKKDDGSYEIVPEEAEIVRRIYREFLNGKAMSEITRNLIMKIFLPQHINKYGERTTLKAS